jgi:hypothetical protein
MTVECPQWIDTNNPTGGRCSLGVRDNPSRSYCNKKCPVRCGYKTWPFPARVIRRLRTDADKGVGDTLTRLIAGVGGEAYKALMASLGRPCGCKQRQAYLNGKYPYTVSPQ